MTVWFSGAWAPSYVQLNCSTIYLCFLCCLPDCLCIIMKYAVSCYSISALVCFRSGSQMACLSITLLYIHGHGLVKNHVCFFALLWGITCTFRLPCLLYQQTADATLQTLDKPPEQLNRFILVSIHPVTCQHGDGREDWLWMCCTLSE